MPRWRGSAAHRSPARATRARAARSARVDLTDDGESTAMNSTPVYARLGAPGEQVVEVVVDQGYRPQAIVARAGVPLRMVFRRSDDDACMDRIVFSSPHLERRLARGTTTTIVLPAQPAGEIRFTCGMGRYHGVIELRTEAASSISGVRSAVADGLRRGWHLVRRSAPPPVEQEAMAIVRARSAPGRNQRNRVRTRSRSGRET